MLVRQVANPDLPVFIIAPAKDSIRHPRAGMHRAHSELNGFERRWHIRTRHGLRREEIGCRAIVSDLSLPIGTPALHVRILRNGACVPSSGNDLNGLGAGSKGDFLGLNRICLRPVAELAVVITTPTTEFDYASGSHVAGAGMTSERGHGARIAECGNGRDVGEAYGLRGSR